jgi:hypothetical protein
MRTVDCRELIDLAPELAIGNLCGDERAAAIVHLDGCPSCQAVVSSFTVVTDRLLLLTPRAEPSAGFEHRALAGFARERTTGGRRRRTTWRLTMLAVAAAFVVTLVAGVLLAGLGLPDEPAYAQAEMRTSTGDVVGEVFLHRDDPTALFMRLPGWAEQVEPYGRTGTDSEVRIETVDGHVLAYPVTLTDEASWATTLHVDLDMVTGVSVVDGDGHVWCHASFD